MKIALYLHALLLLIYMHALAFKYIASKDTRVGLLIAFKLSEERKNTRELLNKQHKNKSNQSD